MKSDIVHSSYDMNTEALINLAVSLVVIVPLMFLSWWVLRKTPLQGLSGASKWRAYRIWFGAVSLIVLGLGLILFFLFGLISSVIA